MRDEDVEGGSDGWCYERGMWCCNNQQRISEFERRNREGSHWYGIARCIVVLSKRQRTRQLTTVTSEDS